MRIALQRRRTSRKSAQNACRACISPYLRRLGLEQLEDRRMLSVASLPISLPGMELVDPIEDQFEGQIVYLDFDGEEDVTYDGPVVVEGIDIPAFEMPGELAGQEEEIIGGLVSGLERAFAGTSIILTTTQPAGDTEYSTIYIGGQETVNTGAIVQR